MVESLHQGGGTGIYIDILQCEVIRHNKIGTLTKCDGSMVILVCCTNYYLMVIKLQRFRQGIVSVAFQVEIQFICCVLRNRLALEIFV